MKTPPSRHKPYLSRAEALVLAVALGGHFLVTLFTPSRPYFVAPWHLALTVAVAVGAAATLVGWTWARFGVPARAQTRWRITFWLLWGALAAALAPAAFLHVSQSNHPPLVRLISLLVTPMVAVYIVLHRVKVPAGDAPDAGPGARDV